MVYFVQNKCTLEHKIHTVQHHRNGYDIIFYILGKEKKDNANKKTKQKNKKIKIKTRNNVRILFFSFLSFSL